MQLRQILKYYTPDTEIKIITTAIDGDSKQDVTLYSGNVHGILATQQFFNSILDVNISEEAISFKAKVIYINV